MHAEQRRQLRSDYASRVENGDVGMFYRGASGRARAMKVYDACVAVRDSGDQFETQQEFKSQVAQRLRDQGTFGLVGSVAMIFLIAKLVMLFIELWMTFDPVMNRLHEEQVS